MTERFRWASESELTERFLRQCRKGPFKGKGAEACEARVEATAYFLRLPQSIRSLAVTRCEMRHPRPDGPAPVRARD